MALRNKQTSRVVLLLGATAIVALTLWSSGRIARTLRTEEQRKVELWSEAIVQRAELVRYTDALFASLRTEERDKADLMGEAYRIIQEAEPGAPIDLTFITRFIQGNRTIPVLVYKDGELQADIHVPEPLRTPERLDSMRVALESKGSVIEFEEGSLLYYDQSNRFRELRSVMDDIIHSFISETVINSASIPVLLADSSLQRVLQADRFAEADLADTTALIQRLAATNPPIALDLPETGRRWILRRVHRAEAAPLFPGRPAADHRGLSVARLLDIQCLPPVRTEPGLGGHGQGDGPPARHTVVGAPGLG